MFRQIDSGIKANRRKNMLKKILSHICIVLSLMMITFFIIDIFNDAMAFLNNGITKAISLVLSISAIIISVINIYEDKMK